MNEHMFNAKRMRNIVDGCFLDTVFFSPSYVSRFETEPHESCVRIIGLVLELRWKRSTVYCPASTFIGCNTDQRAVVIGACEKISTGFRLGVVRFRGQGNSHCLAIPPFDLDEWYAVWMVEERGGEGRGGNGKREEGGGRREEGERHERGEIECKWR